MRLRFARIGGGLWSGALFAAMALLLATGVARAADTGAGPPRTAFWLEQAMSQIEAEATADFAALPAIPGALDREWRSLDRRGSALGTVADLGWITLVAIVAVCAEKATARLASRRLVRRLRARVAGPSIPGLLGLLACDLLGLVVFVAVFTGVSRHWLTESAISPGLAMLAVNVLVRWRVTALVIGAVLRPGEPVARLIEIGDAEARRLDRFVSLGILVIIALVGFGRYELMDEDSGAAHVLGLLNALIVCALYLLIVCRSREATEALIRGRRSSGVIAALRAATARAWLAVAVALVAGLMVFFIAGLSLGMLSYYHAVTSTLGILFVVMVLDRLTERAWHDADPAAIPRSLGVAGLQARTMHHVLRAFGLAIATVALAWIWSDAVDSSEAGAASTIRSVVAAVGTLFIAFVTWELVRLAIDRHLLESGGGPNLPGADDDDDAAAPASRLQTILPLLRAAFGTVIGILAALLVLSRLGIDTAPLIAGAGVFGLAVSFGSQSLVRDIISGLFYMWDDAFRVGEYIDSGRLKGTVETLGVRSVKLRHQNGPLHTIPYGQLGAVTNLSRDFATIKFNLRFDPATDIELVRKTTKQIGLAMQDEPEMAAEIMLPLKLQGIAEVVDNAIVLRFKFTARPVKPSWVQREYLKRMYRSFAEKRICFASGAVMLQTVSRPEPLPLDLAAPAAVAVAAVAAVELAEIAAVPNAAG